MAVGNPYHRLKFVGDDLDIHQAGMDEDERDAKVLGMHQHLKKSKADAERNATEQAVRFRDCSKRVVQDEESPEACDS